MNTLIIFSHPDSHSFNGGILETVIDELSNLGHNYKARNLYMEEFDPVLSKDELEKSYSGILPLVIREHQKDVLWAETIILIYPIWWMSPPAILKGWIDRVFTVGFAYEYDSNGIKGLLNNKKIIMITTSGQSEKSMKDNNIIKAIDSIYFKGTMEYCGFENNIHKNLYGVNKADDKTRKDMLDDIRKLIKGLR